MALKRPKPVKAVAAWPRSPPPAATASPPLLPPPARDDRVGVLDRYDIAILHALQADARLSNTDLAARIGLSAAPTWRRVRSLEAQGVITGYRAEIDRRRIGLGVMAFVRVDAERNNADAVRALEAIIRSLPEVVACHYISGNGTFELQVVTTDLDAYSRWTMDTLFKLPNVKDLHTSFSLGEVKTGGALPLAHLGPAAASAALEGPAASAAVAGPATSAASAASAAPVAAAGPAVSAAPADVPRVLGSPTRGS